MFNGFMQVDHARGSRERVAPCGPCDPCGAAGEPAGVGRQGWATMSSLRLCSSRVKHGTERPEESPARLSPKLSRIKPRMMRNDPALMRKTRRQPLLTGFPHQIGPDSQQMESVMMRIGTGLLRHLGFHAVVSRSQAVIYGVLMRIETKLMRIEEFLMRTGAVSLRTEGLSHQLGADSQQSTRSGRVQIRRRLTPGAVLSMMSRVSQQTGSGRVRIEGNWI